MGLPNVAFLGEDRLMGGVAFCGKLGGFVGSMHLLPTLARGI